MNRTKKAWGNDKENIIDSLLETAKKVPPIHNYLLEEVSFLNQKVFDGASVIDFGCGKGRHLLGLKEKINKGLGIDINSNYIEEANSLSSSSKICFKQGNIENYQSDEKYDIAIAMYNTLGNVDNEEGLIDSMMKSIKEGGKVFISIFSLEALSARLEMYELLGYKNLDIQEFKVEIEENFISRAYSKEMLLKLSPNAIVQKCTDIGWMVILEKKEKR